MSGAQATPPEPSSSALVPRVERPWAETVVLLHGLGRSPLAMLPLAWALRSRGLTVHNLGYVAARRPVEATADEVAVRIDQALASATPGAPLLVVTQSLGGILARVWLSRRPASAGAVRLVQLCPPNQGAHLAERLRDVRVARGVLGRTLDDLSVSAGFRPPALPAHVEAGVIAGGRGGPRGYGPWLEGDNDGVVRVRETWLPEARDWILVPRLHTFMMNARDVRENVVAFLAGGRFLPDARRLVRDAATGEATHA
jgi:triacylglycerol lipase